MIKMSTETRFEALLTRAELEGQISTALAKALRQAAIGEDVRFINFRYTVPASTQVQLQARSPLAGFLTHILLHYPPGCLALVDVRVDVDREQILPVSGWVALDNATPTFQFHRGQPVKRRDYLDVWLQNRDTQNTHTITVLIVFEGEAHGEVHH